MHEGLDWHRDSFVNQKCKNAIRKYWLALELKWGPVFDTHASDISELGDGPFHCDGGLAHALHWPVAAYSTNEGSPHRCAVMIYPGYRLGIGLTEALGSNLVTSSWRSSPIPTGCCCPPAFLG